MTRFAPSSFANWPAALPTAPAAPEMKTTSPSWISAIFTSPVIAVRLVMPRIPR